MNKPTPEPNHVPTTGYASPVAALRHRIIAKPAASTAAGSDIVSALKANNRINFEIAEVDSGEFNRMLINKNNNEYVDLRKRLFEVLSEEAGFSKKRARELSKDFAEQATKVSSMKQAPSRAMEEPANPTLTLPVNPYKWAERKRHAHLAHMNAVEFLQEVWGDLIAAKAIYQDDIAKCGDDKLVTAVRKYCSENKHLGVAARDVLPPSRSRVPVEQILASTQPDDPAHKYALSILKAREHGRQHRIRQQNDASTL